MEFHESPVSDDSISVNYLPHLKVADIKHEKEIQSIPRKINNDYFHDDNKNVACCLTDKLIDSIKIEQQRREKVEKKSLLFYQDIQSQAHFKQKNGRFILASPFTSPENMVIQRSKIRKMRASLQNQDDSRDKYLRGKRIIGFTTPIKKYRFQSAKQRSNTLNTGNGFKSKILKHSEGNDSSKVIMNDNDPDDDDFDEQESRDIALLDLSTCSSRIINQILGSDEGTTRPSFNKILWKSLSTFNIHSLHLWQEQTKIDNGDLAKNITFVSERQDGITVKTDGAFWERLLTTAKGLDRQAEVTVTLTRDDNLWPEVEEILKTMEPNSLSAFRNCSLWTTIFIVRLPMLSVHSKSIKPGILVAAASTSNHITAERNTTNGGKSHADIDNQIKIQTLQRISWAIAVSCTFSSNPTILSDNNMESNKLFTTSRSEQYADNKHKDNLLRQFEEEIDQITDTKGLMKMLVTFSLQLLECDNVWVIDRSSSQNLTAIIGGDSRRGSSREAVVLNDSSVGKNLTRFLSHKHHAGGGGGGSMERCSVAELRSLQLLVGEMTDEDLAILSLPLYENQPVFPSTGNTNLFNGKRDENSSDEYCCLLLGFTASLGFEQPISDRKLSLAKSIASIAKTSFLRIHYQNDLQRLESLHCTVPYLLNPVDNGLRSRDGNRVSLNALMETVSTERFATSLGARKSVLLIPSASYDSFHDMYVDHSTSMALRSQSTIFPQYVYYMSNGYRRSSSGIGSNSDGCLRHLNIGLPFVDKSTWNSSVSPASASASDDAMSPILLHAPMPLPDSNANSLSMPSSSVRHIEGKADQTLHRRLYETLVLPVDSETVSALIVPVHSEMGILLLILLDKRDNDETAACSSPILGSGSGAVLLKRRRFSSNDSHLIERGAIHQSLSLAVHSIVRNRETEKIHLTSQQTEFDLQRLSGVLDQVALARSRRRLQTRTFFAWRGVAAAACTARRQIASETQTDKQLDVQDYHRIVLALLDGGYRSLDNILGRLSQLLVRLFPSDEVTVRLSSEDTAPSSSASCQPDSSQEADHHEQWRLTCRILLKGDNNASDCLASVTVIRRNISYPFSADDRNLLSSISDVVSLSLRVLPLEVFVEEGLDKGVSSNYIMDYLQQTIPYLNSIGGVEQKSKSAAAVAAAGGLGLKDDLSDSLCIDFLASTVKNLKRLTGAEAVSLRIRWGHLHRLVPTFSLVDAGLGGDLVVSSEDAPCLSMNQPKPPLQTRQYSESGNGLLESTASTDFDFEFQNERSQSDYLSMKLYDETDTSEIGEIRLVKISERQELSSQQQSMVSLAGQMVVMFISQCNTSQKHRNNLRISQELVAKLDRSLSSVSEELNTQHNRFAVLHRMHSNLLQLLHLNQYLAFHCSSIETLAAKVIESVQSFIPNYTIHFYLLVEGEKDGNFIQSKHSDIYYEEVMTSDQSSGDGRLEEDPRQSQSRRKNIRKLSDFRKLSQFPSVKKSYNNMLEDEVIYLKSVDSSSASSPLGILLLTNSYLVESNTDSISPIEWKEQEEVLLFSLSSSISFTLTKIKSMNSNRTIEQYQQKLSALNRMFDEFSTEKEHLSELVNHLRNSNETLQNALDDMQEKFAEESNESKEKISQLELQQDHLMNNLKTSENEANISKREFVDLQSDWDFLLSTIDEYSVEGRGHSLAVPVQPTTDSTSSATNAACEWLREIASSRNYEMAIVSRSGDGLMSGGCDGKGVYPVASEAMRTGQAVEQKTTLSRSQLASGGKMVVPSMQREALSQDRIDIRIINIPNKYVAPLQASNYACFQFYRVLEEDKWRDNECLESAAKRDLEILQCAVGLVCHSLHSSMHTSHTESKQLQRQQQMTTTLISKIYECTTAFESIWKRGTKDISELTSLIENFASRLLLRSDLDTCTTVSYLWFPPPLSSSTSTSTTTSAAFSATFPQQLGFAEESALAQRAYSSGRSQRRSGVLWIPIVNSTDSLPIALLRVERKPPGSDLDGSGSGLCSGSVDADERPEANALDDGQEYYPAGAKNQRLGFQSSKKPGKGLVDHTRYDDEDSLLFPYKRYQVKITKQEEEVLQYFCRLLVPLFDKDRLAKEISNSVQQAGKAIQLLQSSKAHLQDKLTVEISQRVAMVDLMKGVTELFDASLQERLTERQVLQLVHRIAASATSSDASYLICPQSTLGQTDENSELTPNFKSDVTVGADNYQKEGMDDSGSPKYFTLSTDTHVPPAPVRVHLESSDIEMLVLLTKRIIGTGESTSQQSWAIRRVQESFQSSRDPNEDSVKAERETFYAVAVPVMLDMDMDRGQAAAVLTTARSGIPYSQLERDCLYWLGTMVSYTRRQRYRSEEELLDRHLPLPPYPPPFPYQDKHDHSESITQSQSNINHTGQRNSKGTYLELDFQSIMKDVYSPYLGILKDQSLLHASTTSDSYDISTSLSLDIIVAVCEIVFKGSKAVAWTTTTTSSTSNVPISEHHLLGFPVPLELHNGANAAGANSNTIHTDRGKLTYWITRSQQPQQPQPRHPRSANQSYLRPEKLRKIDSGVSLSGLLELDGCPAISIKIMIPDDVTITTASREFRCSLLLLLLTVVESHMQSLHEIVASVKKDFRTLLSESEMRSNQLETVSERLQSQLKSTTASYEQQLLSVEERHNEIMRQRQAQYEIEAASENAIISFKRNLFHNTITGIDKIHSISTVRKDTVDSHWQDEIIKILCQIFTTTTTNAIFNQITNVSGHIINISNNRSLPSTKSIRQEAAGDNIGPIIDSYKGKAARSNKAFILYLQNSSSKQFMEKCRTAVQHYQEDISILPMLPFEFICNTTRSSSSTSTANPIYFIIPVTSLSTDDSIILTITMTDNNDDHNGREIHIGNVIAVIAESVSILSLLLRHFLESEDHLKSTKLKLRQSAICSAASILTNTCIRRHQFKLMSAAYHRLAAAAHLSRILRSLTSEGKVISSKQHVRNLEGSLADWSEIVRTVSGACEYVTLGLEGLWRELCGPIMSLLSSEIAINGCGLFIENENKEVVELRVVNLTTPLRLDSRFMRKEGSSRVAGRRGVIDKKSARDYGSRIEELCLSIFRSSSSVEQEVDHESGATQRLWRLSKRDSVTESEEQLWLVPVRSARSVVGILRVNVDVGSSRGKRKQTDSFDVFDSYEDQDGRIATAEHKIVNIADTIAPLLFASCHIGFLSSTNDRMSSSLQSSYSRLTCLSIQTSILFRIIEVVTVSLSKEPLQSEFENTRLSIQTRYEEALSEIFGGEVRVRFPPSEVSESESLLPSEGKGDAHVVVLKEPIVGDSGDGTGVGVGGAQLSRGFVQLTISRTAIGKVWSKELAAIENKYISTTVTSTVDSEEVISTISGSKSNALFRDLLPQLNDVEVDHQPFLSTLPSILKSLSAIISTSLTCIDREVEAKKNVTKSVATLTALESVIKNLKASRIELALREANAVSSEDNHRLLSNCLTGYIMYCANAVHTISKASSRNGLSYLKKVLIILSSLLSKDRPQLVTRFAAVVTSAGATVSSAGFSVEPPSSSTSSPLQWIQHPADAKPAAETSIGGSILTNENVKEIADNLAYSCLQKRTKTFVDVNADPRHRATAATTATASDPHPQASTTTGTLYRIISAPVTHNTIIVGVLQVIVSSHSYLEKNGHEEYNKLETDCERVAELIGCLVIILQAVENSHLAKPPTVDARSTREELLTQLEAAEAAAEVWHQRCNAWRAVCLTGVTSFENCLLPGAKAIKMIKDDFVTCLQGTGVAINVRKESSQVQQGQGHGPSASVIGSCNTIELNDSKKHIIEISCAVNVDRAGPDSLVSVADDLVYCLTVIVNSTISIITAKEKLELRGNRRSKISDTKTLKLRTELATISSELHQSLTKNAALTADAAALAERHELTINHSGYLLQEAFTPTMSQLISSLESMLRDKDSESGTAAVAAGGFEENKLWHEYVILLQRLVKNACFRSTCHVTAIVNVENTGGRIRMFDGLSPDGIDMSLNRNTREPKLSTQQLASVASVEESFFTGRISERVYDHPQLVPQDNNFDFMGIDDSLPVNTAPPSANEQSSSDSHLRAISFPLVNCAISVSVIGVIKLIMLESNHNKVDTEFHNIELSLLRSIIPILGSLFAFYYQLSLSQQISSTRKSVSDEHEKLLSDKMDRLKIQLSRARRLHRLVGRESLALSELSDDHELLSLRSRGGSGTYSMIEKFCQKTLTISRNLITCTSQAIILSDFDFNSPEACFQLLHSGNVLSWQGVRAGSCVDYPLPPSSHLSIIGYVASRQKPLVLEDVTVDSRYMAAVDGVCAPSTPYMAVPLRGHHFLSIGVLIFARKAGEIGFGAEELIAAEMLSYFCSLTLNYCNSLNQLNNR